MKTPLFPLNEVLRLKELQQYDILGTFPETSFDDLTTLAARICETSIALISLVDEHRLWFKSKVGLTVCETPRDTSFCAHAILQPDLFIIPDAQQDDRFADNPLVTGDLQVRFYAGAPLVTPSGHALGTLCVMDHVPREQSLHQQDALQMLARQVMAQLELRLQSRTRLEMEERFRMLTENARVGLFILDRDHHYLYANKAYAEILGQPLADFIGRHMQEALPNIFEQRIRPRLERAFSGERVAFETTRLLPDGLDEFLLAGYLRKKSVEMVKCETNDLEVPANADFVIEGYIDPKEPLRDEGPFGDHTGYYTLPEPYPVFHVTAITHRKDAVYPATIVGIPPMEDFYMGGASVKLFLPIFKMNFPEIVDIALPAEGVFHNLVVVSIKKTYPMQAYKIMHGLWGMGQMMFTKYIIVVDADVNVHNTSEVLFHLCANTDPQRDSIFTKGPADVLDHATSEIAIGTKQGIDATKKLPGEGFKRPWPPLIKMDEAVKAKINRILRK